MIETFFIKLFRTDSTESVDNLRGSVLKPFLSEGSTWTNLQKLGECHCWKTLRMEELRHTFLMWNLCQARFLVSEKFTYRNDNIYFLFCLVVLEFKQLNSISFWTSFVLNVDSICGYFVNHPFQILRKLSQTKSKKSNV